MQPAASQSRAQVPDIAGQVTHAMRVMGVPPLPRNYELFYEAYIGSNPKLTKELAALGGKATQEELDALGEQYFSAHRPAGMDRVQKHMANELVQLLTLLKEEQSALESYNKVLSDAYSNMTSKSVASSELLKNAIGILSDATETTMSQGKERVENVVQKSFEMEIIRKELDEYKRIANTDSLTRLANRRAFDEKLATVYNDDKTIRSTGLLVADIDHFKKINDNFGHPVGDKILASVANIIRTNLRRDAFVARTGGEEFAVILGDTSITDCVATAERIRAALEATPFKNSKTGADYGPITLSLGVCMATDGTDPNDLYSKSDIALYCAKNAGRNRTMAFEDGMKKESSKSWLIYRK